MGDEGRRVAPRPALRDLPVLVMDAVRLIWSASRREFALAASLTVVAGVATGLQVVLLRQVLDAVAAAARGAALAPVVVWLALLSLVTLVASIAPPIQNELQRLIGELGNRRVFEEVFRAAAAADLPTFESPEFYDRLERAWAGGGVRPVQLSFGIVGLVGAVAQLMGLTAGLLALAPILVPILLVVALPILALTGRASELLYRFAWEFTAIDRVRAYIARVLTHREFAHEVIVYGLAGFLQRRWRGLYDRRMAELGRLVRRRLTIALAGAVISAALIAVPVAALVALLIDGRLVPSQAIAAAVAVVFVRPAIEALFHGVDQLYESTLFLQDYRAFLAMGMPRPHGSSSPAAVRGLSLLTVRDLEFKYPGMPAPTLRSVSMELRPGEVVALVGENGSGKTTLAKLICGLYTPTRGAICWDGVDLRELGHEVVSGAVAVVFQDFCRFCLSVRDNIGVGRTELAEDEAAVRRASRRAGSDAFIRELPRGYDTLLGPQFEDGVDLSVGQWQRLALARAFLRDAPLVILDEPTAALDPMAERELFESIRELFEGRAVMLISHRFSSVRSADRIYVLDGGRIVEGGTHEELMAAAGCYSELFSMQATAYGLTT